jgi:glycerate 2-kinase
MTSSAQEKLLNDLFHTALRAVDPYGAVKLYVDNISSVYHGGGFRRFLAVGFGKASCPMAKALEDGLSGVVDTGTVITKYDHCVGYDFKEITVYEAGHPLPDERGLGGTQKIINLLGEADENTLVVCLISGGGSSLLVSPYEGITLTDKQNITDLLLRSGADIHELNAVRKHLSKVKGGRLAGIAYPARIISLIISDVIGDRLDVIASGPTSPDSTTYREALQVIEKYGLKDRSPRSVYEVLKKGAEGLFPETPKEGNHIFDMVENRVIGNNKKALEAAKTKAESMGLDAEIISSELTGEARKVGRWLAAMAIEIKNAGKLRRPRCLISGGETTVNVEGSGLGGRNMELALSFAMEIRGMEGITLLSVGTDGTDGPTDAAGAVVCGWTISKAGSLGLAPESYLENNDSYNFFKKTGDLFITGPTGTNVMDIQILAIE